MYPLNPYPKRSYAMAKVMIRCTTTGKLVPTGFDMARTSFETAVLEDKAFQCPACGQMHMWDKEDARLEPTAIETP
jgi:predicted RNA-binding Zn-ribbon protein involved in translation (DUF1610 family)